MCNAEVIINLTDNDSYHLLICFADSLDPDKAIHYVGSDLDPNCLTV